MFSFLSVFHSLFSLARIELFLPLLAFSFWLAVPVIYRRTEEQRVRREILIIWLPGSSFFPVFSTPYSPFICSSDPDIPAGASKSPLPSYTLWIPRILPLSGRAISFRTFFMSEKTIFFLTLYISLSLPPPPSSLSFYLFAVSYESLNRPF